ncbi:MAG: T9SS type A sorting domain-containing protein [Candidatus Electryonea clarkiae]|nr:T9SS type A sorting domain-containing protein [Candidatus Electryonea clarkiae]MDP8285561.1 T9SS type A sorting domain-containing protein [Candidatus Electryonea clarkiae]
MIRKTLASFVLSLLLVVSISFGKTLPSPKIPFPEKFIPPVLDLDVAQLENAPAFVPHAGELDEDTVIIGTTLIDLQHYGTIGRMIGYYPDEIQIHNEDDCVSAAFFVLTRLVDYPEVTTRVRFNRVGITDEGEFVQEFGEFRSYVDEGDEAGFPVLAMDLYEGLAYPVYNNSAGGYSVIATELYNLFPGVFSGTRIPPDMYYYPKAAFAEYANTHYVHVVTQQYDPDNETDPVNILYSRIVRSFDGYYDFILPEEQLLVSDNGMNPSADIDVSYDGSLVAIVSTISRSDNHPNEETNQWNNDVYLWISEDGGETWDFDNPINITEFIIPDPDLLPDTTAANTDTMRVYNSLNVYIDYDDVIHVAFTASGYYHYSDSVTYTSYIYHWDNENNEFTVLADGQFWNYAEPGRWQHQVKAPNMYHDPVTGILYCVFQQYGMPDEYTINEDSTITAWDASDDSLANGEIMITLSPPNGWHGEWYGRLWTKPVNLTNSRGTEGGLVAGDCRNEREPSIALNNDGDYLNGYNLNISYILDLDAGSVMADEGEFTNNPVIYYRIAKRDLLDSVYDLAGWVPNYPLHIDSAGHWEDPYHYDWYGWYDPFFRDHRYVEEHDFLSPVEFQLEQNYPNPFNSSTQIAFSLQRAGKIKLAVYDILGREVAVILNRKMNSGRHTVNFELKNNANGIYIAVLSSGDVTKAMKVVYLK